MNSINRMFAALGLAAMVVVVPAGGMAAEQSTSSAQDVVDNWYKLVLELTRHTPTYTPPVASRSYAYIGVAAFEVVASGSDKLQTLAGQLNGLTPLPKRAAGKKYDDGVALEHAMALVVGQMFENTGPTGHRAMDALKAQLDAEAAKGLPADEIKRSEAYGTAVATHILAWSKDDGGASVVNMGFPLTYKLNPAPGHWVPTNTVAQQQAPLLPDWGNNRPLAMPKDASCALPAPPAYSEDPTSEYYKQAMELVTTKKSLTPEQLAIAKFWADDAMLSVTPPGHWISIGMQVLDKDHGGLEKSVDVLARLGIAEADAFIGCWQTKYEFDTVRPITYIHKLIDPKWETVVNTPPFPEYPSGHSTQSAAAATVLTTIFGDSDAFDDATDEADTLKPRHYANFWAAANEAGISRLYAGIHYRAAIDNGLSQGRCIGAYAVALKTWK
jgi:hypothetical protein